MIQNFHQGFGGIAGFERAEIVRAIWGRFANEREFREIVLNIELEKLCGL